MDPMKSSGAVQAIKTTDQEIKATDLAKLEILARGGDSTAQCLVGKSLLARGSVDNLKDAVRYIRLSADQGNAMAKFELGLIDIEDKLAPVYQNYSCALNPTPEEQKVIIETALTHIEDSARLGYAQAQTWLDANRSSYR